MKLLVVLFTLFLLCAVHALVIIDSALASSCLYYMKGFNWGCGGTGQSHHMYKCRCANIDWLGSVGNCIATQGTNAGEISHAFAHAALRCKQRGNKDYVGSDIRQWAENATAYLQMPTANDTKVQVYHPLAVNETDFAIYERSFSQINHHVLKTQWFGWGLVFFWAALLAVHTVFNFMWRLFRINIFGATLYQIHQKYLSPKTAFFGLSRWNIVIFSLFTIQTVLVSALSYTVELPNVYIKDPYLLKLDLIGYRTGIISFSLMPLTFIFGIRNNPFCWLTGLPHSEFIIYHKVAAIFMSIEAMIHSAVWTHYAFIAGPYTVWSVDAYWKWGVVGTILAFLILFQSFRFIRTLMYETFLVVHKLFGWLFIVSMWYHCNILGWMGWVYSLIALTAYDRLVRFFKIFVVNRGFTDIIVTVVDEKVLRISIPKPMAYDVAYRPGSHVYLSFFHWPIWYQCFQSHPFTVISSPVVSSKVLTIYVRVKKGTTAKLAKLRTNEKGYLSMWALIDGPYGEGAVSYRETDSVVGIAGGMGVCGILPSLYNAPANSKLYWVINNANDVVVLSRDIDYLISRGMDVKVLLTSVDETDDTLLLVKSHPYISVEGTRPAMADLVADAVEFGKKVSATDLFIVSCGAGSMDTEIGNSISKKVEVGQKMAIHHQLESFTW